MLKLNRYNRMLMRESFSGSALAEYGLPLALVVVSAGGIGSMVDINNLIPNFMSSASGSNVTGTTLNSPAMGSSLVNAAMGNGGAGGAGSQAYLSSGSGAFNVGSMGPGGGGGGGGTETVGGRGNDGWRTLVGKLPGPVVRPDDSQSDEPLGYREAVQRSVDTGRRAEAAPANDQETLNRFVAERAADAARVDVAAIQNPEEVDRYGGQIELLRDSIARGESQIKLSDGDNEITVEVDEENLTINGDSDSGGGGLFNFTSLLRDLLVMIQDPLDTANAANPDIAEPWMREKDDNLKGRVVMLAAMIKAEKAAQEAASEANAALAAARASGDPDAIADAEAAAALARSRAASAAAAAGSTETAVAGN